MTSIGRGRLPALLGWGGAVAVTIAPVVIAAFSPYLASRSLPYIVGGFAGVACLSLLFLQPLLAAGYLAGSKGPAGRRWHRWLGAAIVLAVALHVGGLYLASPEDTMDALLLLSPTPFSVYGVTAMWGVVATAILVLLRSRFRLRPSNWRLIHNGVATMVVVATVIHALQIEGAMEPGSKWMLCMAVVAATGVALLDLRVVKPMLKRLDRAPSRNARASPGPASPKEKIPDTTATNLAPSSTAGTRRRSHAME